MSAARLLALLSVLSLGCKREAPPPPSDAPAPEILSAHTAGLISRRGALSVEFSRDLVPASAVGRPLERALLQVEPAVPGELRWISTRELRLTPSGELKPGQIYRVTVDLPALLPADPAVAPYVFEVQVVGQAVQPEWLGLESDSPDGKAQRYVGRLRLADVADAAAVEAALSARHGEDALKLEWSHGEDGREHRFTVTGIRRREDDSTLQLDLDGAPLGLEISQSELVPVPGLNQFVLASWRAETRGERFIELRFSDPLDPRQALDGLVRVAERDDVRPVRDGSVLRLYADGPWSATEVVHLGGLKSAAGYTLREARELSVSFAPMNPDVRILGTGVIVPDVKRPILPIETTNLRALVVEAVAVPAGNVPQLLQVNQLDGHDELERVGRVVWSQRVPIEGADERYNRPTQLGLDLSSLVARHPAGLYELTLRYEREDLLLDCPALSEEEQARARRPAARAWDAPRSESSFWDYWGEDGEGWDGWAAREDPCDPSYFLPRWDVERGARRNVVLSNLGLMVRQAADGRLSVVATDLRSAQPAADATLELLDYQLQPLATARTDGQGFASLEAGAEHPFLVVGRRGEDRAWLRLDRGAALQVSHFDVGGVAVTEGLQGFLYGERGVWRPGDPIYLNLIVHDQTGRLPDDHPVELELIDPRGRVADRRTVSRSSRGLYRLETRTAPDAPTGAWLARVTVGGARFEQRLAVESIMPNRLKIGFDLGKKMITAEDLALDGTLESRWLHGASAAGLRADVQLSLSSAPTTFPRFAEYSFDDPGRRVSGQLSELWEGSLDDAGKARVVAAIPVPEGAPGMLQATLQTRVFEPSGAFSIDSATVPVSPHPRYVGLKLPRGDAARGMLLTDTDQTVQIVSLDASGQPRGDGEVELTVHKLRWRWWWEKGEEDPAEFEARESREPVARGRARLKGGRASWSFQVRYPDWGRYLVTVRDVDGTHSAGSVVYIDWPGWAGRAQKDNPGGASVLTLGADRQKAAVGEPVTLSFPMAAGSRALVSVESASEVLSSAWVEAPAGGGTGRYTLQPTPEMAPNVYARVTLLQPHAATNDAPLRLYGVIPLEIYNPDSKLSPVIEAASVVEPERKATVQVKEQRGRAMSYTLAVVDEGLLGLTRFQTPDPWAHFHRRQALGVRGWDLYDAVLGATGGALEGLLSVGGDGEGLAGAQPQAQRFQPMVWFEGPFELAAGQTASHEVPIPAFIGEARVMVVASGDEAWGRAERAMTVKKPLMVLATLPRVLSVGDEVDLPVSVFALEPGLKDVAVSVQVEGPVALVGAGSKKLRFERPGDRLASFRLKVTGAGQLARVRVSATGGGQQASQQIELDVRLPGAPGLAVARGAASAGKRWTGTPALVAVAGSEQRWLEVSTLPPLNLSRHLEALIRYPHGCAEQTTSAAFPQVHLSRLMQLGDEETAAIDRNVRAALQRLRGFQTSRGGFGYWPGEGAHDWASTYVGHFLLEAERAGWSLPAGMRAAWVAWQRERANRWVREGQASDLEQAYRLYTLALAGSPDLGAMNRLRESQLQPAARWRLAAAYQLAGQKDTASRLYAGLSTEVADYRETGGTFGSDLRDEAMILEAAALLGDAARADALAKRVSAALDETTRSPSTQEMAMGLVALSRYAAASAQGLQLRWSQGGGAPRELRSERPLARLALNGKGAVSVENTGATTVYTRLIERGTLPLGEEQPLSQGLSLTVSYQTLDGQPQTVEQIEHGADLLVSLRVRNESAADLDELALTWMAPSGWEISGLSPGAGEGYEYRDVRDDRVSTYFDLDRGAELELKLPVNASYSGRYYLPPTTVEAMYDEALRAVSPGRWIEIRATPGS